MQFIVKSPISWLYTIVVITHRRSPLYFFGQLRSLLNWTRLFSAFTYCIHSGQSWMPININTTTMFLPLFPWRNHRHVTRLLSTKLLHQLHHTQHFLRGYIVIREMNEWRDTQKVWKYSSIVVSKNSQKPLIRVNMRGKADWLGALCRGISLSMRHPPLTLWPGWFRTQFFDCNQV